ncbi:MAG: hypothetical protein ACXWV9_10690 [Flavisolibacter sp.]
MLRTISLIAILVTTSFFTFKLKEEKPFCEGVKYFIKTMNNNSTISKLKGELINEDLYFSKVILKGWENESILDNANEFSFSTFTKPASDKITNDKYAEVRNQLIKCVGLKQEEAIADTADYFSCNSGQLNLQLLIFPRTEESLSYIGLTIRKSKD